MSKVIINWKPGVTKLQNIKTLDMSELYQKGFFLLLGGSAYRSNLTYERLVPIYLGTSFDRPLGKALILTLEDSGCVHRFLKNNYDMDLLFICGILQQPDAEIISPDNVSKVRDIIVDHLEPYCNEVPTEITNGIEVEHIECLMPLYNNKGAINTTLPPQVQPKCCTVVSRKVHLSLQLFFQQFN
ncbi:MAG: hypothetical protein U5K69_12430 [Balneolaceae bacterium]|nr:hypothetical protein [Balneolaceae bacterium]